MSKKILILLGIVAILGFTLGSALANEVRNPGFEDANPLNYWTQAASYANFSTWQDNFLGIFPSVSNSTVAGRPYYAAAKAAIYQVLDDKYFWGTTDVRPTWNDAGTQKQWTVSLNVSALGDESGTVYLFYYPTNPDTAPIFTDPFAGNWVNVLDNSFAGVFNPIIFSGTITNFQPRWFAIVLEAQVGDFGQVFFDDIDVTGVCAGAVPVPPAVWLFGSGLVGLFGLRRKFGK